MAKNKKEKLLPSYFGTLSPREIADGMNAIKSNARRLYEDAKILYEANHYPSALALACLAIEESGKIAILRRLACAKNDNDAKLIWREFRSHTSKNQQWIFTQLVIEGARNLHDFHKIYDNNSDHPEMLDSLKQISIYVDCYGQKNWSIPSNVIDAELTKTIMFTADILSKSNSKKSEREIELWRIHVGESEPTIKNLIAWHKSMRKEGLTEVDTETFISFVTPRNKSE